MTIIEINAHEDGSHNLQSRNGAVRVWEDGYIEVPAHLEAKVWESLGWCELVIDEETGVLTDIIPGEKPEPPEPPEPEPSELDKLKEQVDGLEQDKADKTDVQAVWDSMAAAYQEGVQSA